MEFSFAAVDVADAAVLRMPLTPLMVNQTFSRC